MILKKAGYNTMPAADVWQERPEIKLSAGAMLMPAIRDVLERFEQFFYTLFWHEQPQVVPKPRCTKNAVAKFPREARKCGGVRIAGNG